MTGETAGPLPGLTSASMTTRDGIRLDADIWRPTTGTGPWPVLLMRQAYGRRLGSSLCYAHPAWYAGQGFMVVVQDVRGRGTSEGVFDAFRHEGADGAEAVEWAAGLAGSNGHVGLFGFSYQGTLQLLAAAHRPPALKAMAPAMVGWDLTADWVSEQGAMRLAPNLGWGVQMAALSALHQGEVAAFEKLASAARGLPLAGAVPGRPEALATELALGHYPAWRDTPADDPFWAGLSPAAQEPAIAAAGIPALFVGGWFDTHLIGTLAAHKALGGTLIVGPWTHFPWDRLVGERDFGPEAAHPIDAAQVAFFRYWLAGEGAPPAPLQWFDMGTLGWCHELAAGEVVLHLAGDGRVSVATQSGHLLADPAAPAVDYLVHDPWRPAPACGGAFATPAGPVDRARHDQRADVLTFTTAPMAAPLAIAGAVSASLSLLADAPSCDIACTLSRIDAEGRVWQIAEGYRR
ncbi:MAG TPA: CocE/NonD family hydrolase, partial [Novosphingobium sp.]|nr:CocE/NonD family hydrolase [Novosphingobium sp.]